MIKDSIQIISGSSHRAFAESIAKHVGKNLVEVESFKFKNDNYFVKIKENVRESDVFVVQTSVPPVNDRIMELFMLVDALKHSSARRITAVIPYMPYVRSDKKDQPRISIAARLFAQIVRNSGC